MQFTEVCICRGSGDVHYYTFDGQKIDFQGKCKYTMAKYDNPNDAQCSFNIEVKQIDGLIRNGKKGVGYAEQVWLKKNGRTYIINQGRRVHVRTLLLFQEMNSKLAFSELCICKMF